MSADLFEAFVGTPKPRKDLQESNTKHSHGLLIPSDNPKPENTWQSWPKATETASKSLSEHQPQSLWETDDNGRDVLFDAGGFDAGLASSTGGDDFGDFEQAVTQTSDSHVSQVASQLATANLLDLGADGVPSKEVFKTKNSLEAVGPSGQDVSVAGQFSQINPKQEITTSTDEQDDDGWGDFETIEVRDTHAHHPDQREAPQKATALVTHKKSDQVGARPQEKPTPSPLVLKPSSIEKEDFKEEDEEPWDNFDDDKLDRTYVSKTLDPQPTNQDLFESGASASVVQRDRPTNVPPPAVLLAWLPKMFSVLATQARQQNEDVGVGIPALQAYRVGARVIAGRAARWKRDHILAQSMKIGVAGRSGGMKLTALDKGESRKEDQAAEEVIASWTRFSHVLNAAIIKAKAQKPPMALSIKLSARTATGLDVVIATHICAICGLRRNERIIGIDISVSDTFGEFWVEHWGHKDCADIWYGFNKLLEQR